MYSKAKDEHKVYHNPLCMLWCGLHCHFIYEATERRCAQWLSDKCLVESTDPAFICRPDEGDDWYQSEMRCGTTVYLQQQQQQHSARYDFERPVPYIIISCQRSGGGWLCTRFCLCVCLCVINFRKQDISKTNLWIFAKFTAASSYILLLQTRLTFDAGRI